MGRRRDQKRRRRRRQGRLGAQANASRLQEERRRMKAMDGVPVYRSSGRIEAMRRQAMLQRLFEALEGAPLPPDPS